jgi:hypothetical protein
MFRLEKTRSLRDNWTVTARSSISTMDANRHVRLQGLLNCLGDQLTDHRGKLAVKVCKAWPSAE